MTRDKYLHHIKKTHADAAELAVKKSSDYTGDGDVFDSWTIPAQVAGITPEKYLIALMSMKLIRIRSVLDKGTQNFESLTDSCIDISNYAVILDALVLAKKEEKSRNPQQSQQQPFLSKRASGRAHPEK